LYSPGTLTALEKRKRYEEESNYREFGSPGLFRKSLDTKALLSNKTDKYLQA